MADERVTVSVREIGTTETVRWLRIGHDYVCNRPLLQHVQRIGTMPETIIGEYWLDERK